MGVGREVEPDILEEAPIHRLDVGEAEIALVQVTLGIPALVAVIAADLHPRELTGGEAEALVAGGIAGSVQVASGVPVQADVAAEVHPETVIAAGLVRLRVVPVDMAIRHADAGARRELRVDGVRPQGLAGAVFKLGFAVLGADRSRAVELRLVDQRVAGAVRALFFTAIPARFFAAERELAQASHVAEHFKGSVALVQQAGGGVETVVLPQLQVDARQPVEVELRLDIAVVELRDAIFRAPRVGSVLQVDIRVHRPVDQRLGLRVAAHGPEEVAFAVIQAAERTEGFFHRSVPVSGFESLVLVLEPLTVKIALEVVGAEIAGRELAGAAQVHAEVGVGAVETGIHTQDALLGGGERRAIVERVAAGLRADGQVQVLRSDAELLNFDATLAAPQTEPVAGDGAVGAETVGAAPELAFQALAVAQHAGVVAIRVYARAHHGDDGLHRAVDFFAGLRSKSFKAGVHRVEAVIQSEAAGREAQILLVEATRVVTQNARGVAERGRAG